MKIKVIRGKYPIKVYHDPHEVLVHPKEKTVDIYEGTQLVRKYELIKKQLDWLDNGSMDCNEVIITLVVGKTIKRN